MMQTCLKFDRNMNSYEFGLTFLKSLPAMFYCQSFDDNAFWQKADAMGILN